MQKWIVAVLVVGFGLALALLVGEVIIGFQLSGLSGLQLQ
jgi:hypothetical protein